MSNGSVNIPDSCVKLINEILPQGKTIFEFGSGYGTVVLSKWYKMISVENQPEWFNVYPAATTYINVDNKNYDSEGFQAPIGFSDQKGWYNPNQLIPNLPSKQSYDLILIDGPGGWLGRAGILKYLSYFNLDIPIVIDDINRPGERKLLEKISETIERDYKILDNKVTGYII